MGGLYPPIEPYQAGHLRVSDLHELYYEQSGNPDGKPVLFLHGGPGGGTDPKHRRFFDPKKYRIVLVDQRGCGKSRPHAALEGNDTWSLVADLELLREHVGIDAWQVFGGSWGSTLAIAYAETHPDRVTELVLRGIFTFTQAEMDWFYRDGTRALFPDAWADFVAPLPEDERNAIIPAYYKRLTSDDHDVRARFARSWSIYECRVATLREDPEILVHCQDTSFTLPFARIEAHYFVNGGFLDRDTQLLDDTTKIAHLPCTIVHGRYDVICPALNAWRLHERMPNSELVYVPAAGHSAFEPGIVRALVAATDKYAG